MINKESGNIFERNQKWQQDVQQSKQKSIF